MRRRMLGAIGGKAWTNPYITDGLVAMWDGEWNAGGGVHDDSATSWYDLSGNGNNFPITAKVNISWEENCILKSGATNESGGLGCLYGLGFNSSTTVESVIMPLNSGGVSAAYVVGGPINSTLNRPCIVLKQGLNFEWSSKYTDRNRFSYGTKYSLSAKENAGYANGVILNGNASDTWGFTDNIISLLGDPRSGKNYQPNCRLYCVRIYNRLLSEREILDNYAVDKARFGLT